MLPCWLSEVFYFRSQSYLQLKINKESIEYVTVNTNKGIFLYAHLPFVVASDSAIFQKIIDPVLQGIPKFMCNLDIFIIGAAEHLDILHKVLQHLQEYGIHIK